VDKTTVWYLSYTQTVPVCLMLLCLILFIFLGAVVTFPLDARRGAGAGVAGSAGERGREKEAGGQTHMKGFIYSCRILCTLVHVDANFKF